MIRICEEGLEIRGGQVCVKVLEFFQTPTANLNKISKNGKGVKFAKEDEIGDGLVLIHTYKIKE